MLVALGIVIVAVFLVAVSWVFASRNRAFSDLSHRQRASYNEWQTKPYHFPEDIFATSTLSTETLSLARDLRDLWLSDCLDALDLVHQVRPDASPDLTTQAVRILLTEEVQRRLEDLAPLTDTGQALVRRPDYAFHAFPATWVSPIQMHLDSVTNLLCAQTVMKLLRLRAIHLAWNRDFPGALAAAEDALRASQCQPFARSIENLFCSSLSIGAIEAWFGIATDCDRSDLLLHSLNELRRIGPVPEFPQNYPLGVLDAVGEIQIARRTGIETNVQGRTAQELYGLIWRADALFLEREALPLALRSPAVRRSILQTIHSYRFLAAQLGIEDGIGPETMTTQVSGWFLGPHFFSTQFRADEVRIRIRNHTARAAYGLLQCEIANRLRALKGLGPATAQADIVPEYLSEMPRDPFSPDRPLRLTPRPHSVGPDGIDQKIEIVYSPVNGIDSGGDLILSRLEYPFLGSP